MPVKREARYPQDSATAEQILRLADEYRKATGRLLPQGQRGDAFSRAPCRLSAIHAIELYLDAFLLRAGHTASDIREMQHNLGARAKLVKKLNLRKRTEDHLGAMSDTREYIATRYDAEMTATLSQINRLTATLEEIASKVTAIVKGPCRAPASAAEAKVPQPVAD